LIPPVQAEPAGHSEQLSEFAAIHVVPSQEILIPPVQAEPAGHSEQLSEFAALHVVPSHAVLIPFVQDEPAGHSEQLSEFDALHVVPPHGVWIPPVQEKPAGQGAHSRFVVVVSASVWYWPPLHTAAASVQHRSIVQVGPEQIVGFSALYDASGIQFADPHKFVLPSSSCKNVIHVALSVHSRSTVRLGTVVTY